ncbi:RNA polymerase sigma factor [Blautia obeum]|uniref:RNA polymerase sigma factor n=1 Tax=Blautia obeum TaxID=40520 RepID=UPI00156E0B26|nr:sigma-70 family RNA polymerase sigma factor [Blautia obeum]NSJ35774.1 sigma-70 family RNA polymerase sigma factor [Blautia obeum]
MEDTHIINLFLERSEDAIRQVEVKYEKFCFKIAWNILYNTEDSEECVNDTWLITWNKIPPKTPTKLSAFLGKITRNLALDNFRKKNASKRADTHMDNIKDIAKRHGCSETKIKSSLFRSRNKLWEEVKEII